MLGMGKTSNKKVILGIMMAITFIAGILVTEFVYADHVSSLPTARIAQSLEALFVDIGLIQTETNKIQMLKDNQYVPFHLSKRFAAVDNNRIVMCPDSGLGGVLMDIRSQNQKPFILSSIVFTVGGISHADDRVWVNIINLNTNPVFNGRTIDVTGDFFDSTIYTFEVLGLERGDNQPGFLPHEISAEVDPIFSNRRPLVIGIQCFNNDSNDMGVFHVQLSGFKQATDNILVTQVT